MIRNRVLEIRPRMAKKTQALPRLSNPYKDSLDDITDEPGFASALREVSRSGNIKPLDKYEPDFVDDDNGGTQTVEGYSVRKMNL